MHILLVAATPLETERLSIELSLFALSQALYEGEFQGNKIHLLHTGVGMTNTAYQLGRYLVQYQPDLAIHFGIAGSFDRSIELGHCVEIVEDIFAELGAESPDEFLDMKALGFPTLKKGDENFYNHMRNSHRSNLSLPKVKGITVNTVNGTQEGIEKMFQRWGPTIETMEGAAFFSAMIDVSIPFFSFRGISNYVEPRNKSNWKIGLAVKNVQKYVLECILEAID